jgi:hypothetical protein
MKLDNPDITFVGGPYDGMKIPPHVADKIQAKRMDALREALLEAGFSWEEY